MIYLSLANVLIRQPDKSHRQVDIADSHAKQFLLTFSDTVYIHGWFFCSLDSNQKWLASFQYTSFLKLDMVDMYLELSIILLSIVVVLVVLILYIVRQTLALSREYDFQLKKKVDEENLWIDRRESDNNVLGIS